MGARGAYAVQNSNALGKEADNAELRDSHLALALGRELSKTGNAADSSEQSQQPHASRQDSRPNAALPLLVERVSRYRATKAVPNSVKLQISQC